MGDGSGSKYKRVENHERKICGSTGICGSKRAAKGNESRLETFGSFGDLVEQNHETREVQFGFALTEPQAPRLAYP